MHNKKRFLLPVAVSVIVLASLATTTTNLLGATQSSAEPNREQNNATNAKNEKTSPQEAKNPVFEQGINYSKAFTVLYTPQPGSVRFERLKNGVAVTEGQEIFEVTDSSHQLTHLSSAVLPVNREFSRGPGAENADHQESPAKSRLRSQYYSQRVPYLYEKPRIYSVKAPHDGVLLYVAEKRHFEARHEGYAVAVVATPGTDDPAPLIELLAEENEFWQRVAEQKKMAIEELKAFKAKEAARAEA